MRLLLTVTLLLRAASAQQMADNLDESKVGPYTLPDPLVMQNGERVRDAQTWFRRRRPELLSLFEANVYGRTVAPPQKPTFEVLSTDRNAINGKAVRRQVRVWFAGKDGPRMDILLYIPASATKPVPAFAGLDFSGNQSVHADPGIRLGEIWVRDPKNHDRYIKRTATDAECGRGASQWQLEKILARGYALATAYYGDTEPDFVGGLPYGVRALSLSGGQTDPRSGEWGALGAWAWGLSRMLDYLQTDHAIDAKKVAIIGHSRLGKATLWAGAQDTRFAIVISNDSGEGGAALSRRNFGETLMRISTVFPHWFCANYRQYGPDPNQMPVDMHELLALIAPRPLYVASAEQDLHSDPRGEFLSAVAAGPVYELLGKQGLGRDQMPGIHQPIMHDIGYHIRAGKHDVTEYDWEQYLKFADMHFSR